MHFSLRFLFGMSTLAAIGMGAAVAAWSISGWYVMPSAVLAVETSLAVYATGDRCWGCPHSLVDERQTLAEDPASATVTRVMAWLVAIMFLLLGGLGAMLLVEDNFTMDTGGAKPIQWLLGLAFVLATAVGGFARGAMLVGWNVLMLGVPLRKLFTKYFGLTLGSVVSLLLWAPIHDWGRAWAPATNGMTRDLSRDFGNLATGVSALVLLLAGWALASWLARNAAHYGRRARRYSAQLYLLGMLLGVGLAWTPTGKWLFFRSWPATLFFPLLPD